MRVFLLYRDRDFGPPTGTLRNAPALTQDLELEILFGAMAAGDEFLLDVARQAFLSSMEEPEAILYRQGILEDCLERPEVVRRIYDTAVEALERERRVWGWVSRDRPRAALHRAVEVLGIFLELLARLRRIADEEGPQFRSEGFARFFAMLSGELNDEYLALAGEHLERLQLRDGILMTAELGAGHRGANYVLRKRLIARRTWLERLKDWARQLTGGNGRELIYEIADRDESGFRALTELEDRGIAHVAAALSQSTDHILSFFQRLRWELGFYTGCLNLRTQLARRGRPISFPEPLAPGRAVLTARGLYDPCLALRMDGRIAGNDVAAEDKALVMVTGANRGGKSTFLRSAGAAQLMMQCGMFVPAEHFRANVCRGVFTHFKREEDTTMKSGKLDEELSRMSSIIGEVTADSLVLFNESFASTNEREGSEIARQIVRALLESGVKVFYVTHLFDLARGFVRANMATALFLRAERLPDGQRTFRMLPGEPLPTSFGEDLYGRIFGPPGAREAAGDGWERG